MSYQSDTQHQIAQNNRRPAMIFGAVCVALIGAMALDTTVVRIGSDQDVRQQGFSPERFGAEKFPEIRAFVKDKAVDAKTLFDEATADKKAAGEKYGVMAGIAPGHARHVQRRCRRRQIGHLLCRDRRDGGRQGSRPDRSCG